MGRKKTGELPSLRFHKASGQGVVTLSGDDHYLGPFGSVEAESKYHELIARWVASGRKSIRVQEGDAITIDGLCERYLESAKVYYRKRGRVTESFIIAKRVAKRVAALFGSDAASGFTPSKFKLCRNSWIVDDCNRNTVNHYARVMGQIFRWGVENELVPPMTAFAIKEVARLARGRSEARESDPIGPADTESLKAVAEGRNRTLADLVQVMMLTAMRPGEACRMRPMDLIVGGSIWSYDDKDHKTEHHNKKRIIAIGPRCQEILVPRIARLSSPKHYVFHSRGKPGRSWCPYLAGSAIQTACRKAGVPPFSINQVRHSALTEIRDSHGIEAARAVAGHSHSGTTAIYAESRDFEAASEVARSMG